MSAGGKQTCTYTCNGVVAALGSGYKVLTLGSFTLFLAPCLGYKTEKETSKDDPLITSGFTQALQEGRELGLFPLSSTLICFFLFILQNHPSLLQYLAVHLSP